MSVARDAVTASSVTFSGDTSINHTPVGTPRGVIVFISQNGTDADEIAGVTYGGVTMTRVTNGYAKDTATEFMASYCYFLGSSIPTGTQAVAIDTSAANGDKIAFIFSLTAANDTAVEDAQKAEENQANPSVTLTTGASVETYVASIITSGISSQGGLNLGAVGTKRGSFDYGQQVTVVGDLDALDAGGGVTFTWDTGATSDDVAMIAVAIKEAAGAAATSFPNSLNRNRRNVLLRR